MLGVHFADVDNSRGYADLPSGGAQRSVFTFFLFKPCKHICHVSSISCAISTRNSVNAMVFEKGNMAKEPIYSYSIAGLNHEVYRFLRKEICQWNGILRIFHITWDEMFTLYPEWEASIEYTSCYIDCIKPRQHWISATVCWAIWEMWLLEEFDVWQGCAPCAPQFSFSHK